jgi:hypothetical protein
MRRGRPVALVVCLALPFAELGHAIAYWPHVPGTGAHHYFPAVLEASGVLVAAMLLTALAVLGAARVLEGRRRPHPAWPFPILFFGLLTTQLAIFLIQESLEARTLPSPATLPAGLLGQQPVAMLGALLLSWLSARLGPAIATLLALLRPQAVMQRVQPATSALAARPPLPPGARPRHTGQQRAPPAALLV